LVINYARQPLSTNQPIKLPAKKRNLGTRRRRKTGSSKRGRNRENKR